MKQYRLVTKAGLLASSAIAAFTFSAPAFAQEAQEAPAVEEAMDSQAAGATAGEVAAEEAPAGDDIVVTGTLIRNPNLEQSTPVNVTTSDAIELKQSNVAEEVLRELPGVVPGIGSGVNNGSNGTNTVDLRGLGSIRNIILLDGNRMVPAGLAGRVDLNNIPLALIDRVDALTGAAVTTYGADAIAGVINFITKRDFAGVEVAASEQITEKGDGNFMRVDLTMGANFDDGRGNAVVSMGYQQSDPVYQSDRDFSFYSLSSYTGLREGSGTSVPSRFSGSRALDPNTCLPVGDMGLANSGSNQGTSQINWGGDSGPNGACLGGLTAPLYANFNFNPYNVFQTPFKRYNIFAQANYEISDAIEIYGRGLFSKNHINSIIAPSGSFGGTVTINLNNPFLPATLRNQFCAFDTTAPVRDAAGDIISDPYTPRFTQAECDAAATATGPSDPNYRTVTAAFNRRSTEAGPRLSNFTNITFDSRVGLRGPLTSTVEWDIAGAYGENDGTLAVEGFTLQSRFRQGSLVNGTLANPVCQNPAGGCVPIDIFGPEGSISSEAADWLTEASSTVVKTSLGQLRGLASGDFGIALPWAAQPIGFAVGTEFRKYKATQRSDTLAKTPGELGGAGGANPDIKGGYAVYEGYAELIAPIVEDRPGFQSLTLETGVRYSKYEIDGAGSNTTWTWKAGGSWEPGWGLKIRGNYSKAVRAPNITELFQPQVVGLTNLGIDPCSGTAPLTNADLRAVCLAQGAPAGTIGLITDPTAGQANAVAGGNLELKPETAKTWTLGVVFVPDFLPKFSVSLDYYNIRVKDVIGSALPGDAIGACFNNLSASSATNPDCQIIRRNPITGNLDGDPATTPGLFLITTNRGELFTDGVDLIANYKTDVGIGDLALSFVGNWTNNSEFNSNAMSADGFFRECVGYYSPNCSFSGSIQPKLQFSQRSTLSVGKLDLSLLWRWIDKMEFEPRQIEDDGGSDESILPKFRTIPAEHYFDLTGRFNASDNMTFTLTVNNLFNNQPKVIGNTAGSTTFNSGNVFPSTYDALGRRYSVGAKLKF